MHVDALKYKVNHYMHIHVVGLPCIGIHGFNNIIIIQAVLTITIYDSDNYPQYSVIALRS